jgi:hypothetical protein
MQHQGVIKDSSKRAQGDVKERSMNVGAIVAALAANHLFLTEEHDRLEEAGRAEIPRGG